MRRTIGKPDAGNAVGIAALVLLALGGAAWMEGDKSPPGLAGGCIRVGLVIGALWFALPQIRSLLASIPRSLMGWLLGKGKSPPPRSSSREGPPPRPPRPRRRSNS
jgi:hypothetical protein